MVELLVKYSIELVSYFLLNPITIRSRNLLLPLANPSTSEITTNQSSTISSFISKARSMTKSDAQKKAGVMAKEWWKSRSNEQTIEDLVIMGVLHNKELAGWHASEGKGYPDPQLGKIMVFKDFFKRGFGFQYILSFRVSVYTTRLGFAICIPTQFSLSPPSFIFAKHMAAFSPISTSFAIFSVYGRKEAAARR